ncbi:helix-turn-helix domain-containing protein [Pseudonocardia halophobica]|uniref:helix-turn-helix domain-containing protein n=1 Tax=Pseudonocardia halophobica TaxID=29401 RepID=UPI003D89D617
MSDAPESAPDQPDPGTETPRRPPPGSLDVSGLVRAVRRRADLSQRELAQKAGVAVSTVGRIEARRLVPTVAALERLLALAGLALVAVDERYVLVEPQRDVPRDGMRDGAGRRYPAHLDVIVQPGSGEWWGYKYGLAGPPETYHRSRAYRDNQRRRLQWETRVKQFRTARRPLTAEEWLRRHPEEG